MSIYVCRIVLVFIVLKIRHTFSIRYTLRTCARLVYLIVSRPYKDPISTKYIIYMGISKIGLQEAILRARPSKRKLNPPCQNTLSKQSPKKERPPLIHIAPPIPTTHPQPSLTIERLCTHRRGFSQTEPSRTNKRVKTQTGGAAACFRPLRA